MLPVQTNKLRPERIRHFLGATGRQRAGRGLFLSPALPPGGRTGGGRRQGFPAQSAASSPLPSPRWPSGFLWPASSRCFPRDRKRCVSKLQAPPPTASLCPAGADHVEGVCAEPSTRWEVVLGPTHSGRLCWALHTVGACAGPSTQWELVLGPTHSGSLCWAQHVGGA